LALVWITVFLTCNLFPARGSVEAGQFEVEVVRSTLPVVVDFYAPWCGPCKGLSPLLDQLAGPPTNKVKFVNINVDEATTLAQRLEIQGVPTLVFFEGGEVVDSLVGLPSSDTRKMRLESLAKVDAVAAVSRLGWLQNKGAEPVPGRQPL
jgi:thioredoxin 1